MLAQTIIRSCHVLRRRCGPEPEAAPMLIGCRWEAPLPKLGKVRTNKELGMPSQSTNSFAKFGKPFFSRVASKSIMKTGSSG